MKRRLDGLIWIGLGVSLLLALFLSPFASSSPDGLEKVAETKGFLEKAEGWKFWKYAPFSDYAISWIKNEKVSTALSGLIGTLAIFFIAMGIGKLIKRSTAPKALFLMILFFSLSSPAFALRPLTTDDAYTVEKGTFQLEAGFDATRQDNHDREYNPSLTLAYGLLEQVDLGIGSGYLFSDPKEGKRLNGLGDTELKLKYRPIDEKDWIPSLAVSGILKIPTASE
jgi:cobalt/nickel transport protein